MRDPLYVQADRTGRRGNSVRLTNHEPPDLRARPVTGKGWLRRLAAHCWRHPRRGLLALGGSLAAMAATALTPLPQRTIVDEPILSPRRALAPLSTGLLLAALVSYAATCL